MHQSTTPSLSQTIWPRWASRQFLVFPIVETLLPVTFGYSLISRKNLQAVVMRQLRRWKRLWQKSLTRSRKRTSMGPSRSCCNGTKSALLRRGQEFHVCTINKSAHTKKQSLETYLMSLVYLLSYLKEGLAKRTELWDCCEFELKSRCYLHFPTNIFW